METISLTLRDAGSMDDVLALFEIHHVSVTQGGLARIVAMRQCRLHLNHNHMSNML